MTSRVAGQAPGAGRLLRGAVAAGTCDLSCQRQTDLPLSVSCPEPGAGAKDKGTNSELAGRSGGYQAHPTHSHLRANRPPLFPSRPSRMRPGTVANRACR